MTDITVVIPAIPPRASTLLPRALKSVAEQTLQPRNLIVEFDHDRLGPAKLRNRLLEKVDTEWVAFLDDDDELRPEHLRLLRAAAGKFNADVVYPWFDVQSTSHNEFDPLGEFGKPFNEQLLRNVKNYIPVTLLARTELVRKAGGFKNRNDAPDAAATCEDWGCWLNLLDAGATFYHLPRRTWIWHWHRNNTSGRNDW